jgi:acetylornithine/succinyldiaminopimelate/putrescine aminotransferase
MYARASTQSKPSYQRSVRQIFACNGMGIFPKSSCGILQAFSFTTDPLDKTYLVNSGTEAIEGALIG